MGPVGMFHGPVYCVSPSLNCALGDSTRVQDSTAFISPAWDPFCTVTVVRGDVNADDALSSC